MTPCQNPVCVHPSSNRSRQNEQKPELQLLPNDRVEVVRPLWESLPQHERVKLLTLDIQLLRDKAHHATELTKQQQAGAWGGRD